MAAFAAFFSLNAKIFRTNASSKSRQAGPVSGRSAILQNNTSRAAVRNQVLANRHSPYHGDKIAVLDWAIFS